MEIINENTDYKIFADGSKIGEDCGMGIHDQETSSSIEIKLKNNTPIQNVELLAIRKAIEHSVKKNYKNTTIFCDSLNDGISLEKAYEDSLNNTIARGIWRLLQNYPEFTCKSPRLVRVGKKKL